MRSIRDIRNILGYGVKSSFLNAGPYCRHPEIVTLEFKNLCSLQICSFQVLSNVREVDTSLVITT